MNGARRIKALMENKPLDRIPIAGWMHMPPIDRDVNMFVEATTRFTDNCEWDLIKVMPNGHHFVEAYDGDIYFYSDPPRFDEELWESRITRFPIQSVQDLEALPVLNPKQNPILRREVAVVEGVATHYKGMIPVLPTLFTPLTHVQELSHACFPDKAHDFIHNHKKELHTALASLLETSYKLIDAYVDAGADGFFIATSYGTSDMLTRDEFEEFCRPYDTRMIEYAKKRTWFNMMHFHGSKNLYAEEFASYNTQAYNWECCTDGIDPKQILSLSQMRKLTDGVLIGGTDLHSDYYGPRDMVKAKLAKRLQAAIEDLGSERFVFAPGCAFPPDMAPCMSNVLKEVVNEYALSK